MLAMLVSMFTVMAFADDEKVSITFNVGENGTIKIGNDKITSGTYEYSYADVNSKYVTVWPDAGYVASVSVGGEELNRDGFNLSTEYDKKTITVTFTEKTPSVEPKPTDPDPTDPDGEYVSLRIGVQVIGDGLEDAEILYKGEPLDLTRAVSFTKSDLKKGVKLTADASGRNYTVSWTLNDDSPEEGSSFKLPKTLKGDNKLLVVFTADTKETKHTLTVSSNDADMGLIQYGVNEKKSMKFSLEEDETIEVTAVKKAGYEFVEWRSSDIAIGNPKKNNPTLRITMPDYDVKVTAVFQKVASKDDYTLKVKVTGNGDVTYNGRDVKSSYPVGKNEELTFKAAASKSSYEVRWCIDNGRWHYTDKSKASITIGASDMGYENATLYIDFFKPSTPTPSTKTYTLTLDITGGKHGTVSYKNSSISDGKTYSLEKNETMTFKAEPDKDYLTVWTFGSEVYLGNSYTVKMGSKDATLYVDFVDKNDYRWGNLPFHDVTNRNWYYDDVLYAYLNGLMDGISMTSFGADQNTTRGQVVTILWRLSGEPRAARSNQFTDVASSAYYNTAISWAAENGIVKGYDSKTFRPNANVTREQLAAILYRYAEYMNLSTRGASNLTKFDDYYSIGTWARDSLAWANYHGLINGVDSYRIDPKGNPTRAQLAAILHRIAVEFG